MPYSVAVSSIRMLERLVISIPPLFYDIYETMLPGKFTFLFEVAPAYKQFVKGSDKIAIRVPDVPGMLKLIEGLGVPLITTSVNTTGEPPLNDPAEIKKRFQQTKEEDEKDPIMLIDAGPLPPSKGSTIIDLTTTPEKCIRKGDDFDQLKKLDITTVG